MTDATPVEVEKLHAEVDRLAGKLATAHAARLNCRRGCSACCVDGLTVFEVEAERIRRRHAGLLAEGSPHAPGACAFLDAEGACRVYDERPYVCRTQGLPLRWLEETGDGEGEEEGAGVSLVELRDICPLNEEGVPVEELAAEECWTLGPFEERLARLQAERDGGTLRRVPLRSLFRNHVED
jgi:uncharacterized protein